MKTTSIISFALILLFTTLSFAQANNDNMVVKNINKLEWHPKPALPPGASSAVLYGDPAKGHYDFYGKFPTKYTVPMHWHTNECMVTIIKGSMVIKRDGLPDVTVDQGGFFTLPAKMQYIAYTPKECIFQVHGDEPFDIFYVNPKDDPRNK